MRSGTHIEVQGWSMDGTETWERARIGRTLKCMLPLPDGYSPVRFVDGGCLLVHASRFRVVDNRAA